MLSASNIISLAQLRATLEQRFPEAALRPAHVRETGWAALDAEEGTIALGAVAELCSSQACGRLFLHRILESARRRGEWAGLVEAGSSFDPQSYGADNLKRLLSVFCKNTEHAVKAADLLLRDANLPLVLLDLQTAPPRSLGRIPANTWHRFQRLVERSGTALVVLTPQPMVEAARTRVVLHAQWDLEALRRPRAELFQNVEVQVFRRGRSVQREAEPLLQKA